MKPVATFLGCLSLLLINVNGCGVPCSVGSPDELAGNCCNRGACGCVKMLGTTAGCDDIPGPGSCTVPALMSTTDAAETCPYPTTYVEGVGCADICGTIVGLTCPSDSQVCYSTDPTGQCADCGGVCLEPAANGCSDPYDTTVSNPFDCQLASSGLYCGLSQICVSGSSASRICEDNERWQRCGTSCPRKCGDPDLVQCITLCQPDVCRCDEANGYVLDEEGGVCILESDCPMDSTVSPMTTDIGVTDDMASTDMGSTEDPVVCGENEEVKACGTACPAKCGDIGPLPCIALCELNVCRCKDGYILDVEDGECIPEDECPTEEPEPETTVECGENEELKACGTACPAKCGDIGPLPCIALCELNVCRCKDGYILDEEDGVCIPEDECPMGSTEEPASTEVTECGENEELKACGTACPAKCGDIGPLPCIALCELNVCRCKDGFILDEEDGECIPEDECPTEEPVIESTEAPIVCEENEELKACGTACPRKCGDAQFIPCITLCEPNVCRCKDGFILDEEDGECIPEDQCPTEEPTVCGDNEELQACGTACPRTCEDDGPIICLAVCEPNVCRCKDGFILDEEDGECIPEDECPMGSTEEPASTEVTECGENEELKACGTACPAKCGDIGPLPCIALCELNVCRCKDGFILDEEDGECIPEDECPMGSTEEPASTEVIECEENEELQTCGTACPRKCGDAQFIPCIALCELNVCRCKDGFILDEEDGECIPEDECGAITTEASLNETEIEVTEECNYPQTFVEEYGCIDICRTILGLTCDDGDVCIDDPRDNCDPDDPVAPGSDCAGYCIPEEPNPSTANAYGLIMVFGVIAGLFAWM